MSISSRTRRALCAVAATATIAAIPVASAQAADPFQAPLGVQIVMGPSLHPSGNDRTVEPGGSGTQGKAQSDPDGNYNYGVDQAGGTGGLYTGDQDGNNGCGNDQDFEDDNNGNCGKAKGTTCTYDSSSGAVIIDTPGNASPEHAQGAPFSTEECTPPDDTSGGGGSTDTGGDSSGDDSWSSFSDTVLSIF